MKRFIIAIAACFVPLLSSNGILGQSETRYTFLMSATKAGQQVSRVLSDGTREFDFEYNDRGRGPKIKTRLKLNPDGVPVSYETTGVDYLKAPVNETFSFDAAVASWKSASESGQLKTDRPGFYVSINGVYEEVALLASALLRAPGRKLGLLPAGEATITHFAEKVVTNGSASRRVKAYEISGLGFTPLPLWLDEDGTFFGVVGSWSSLIREGWEASVDAMVKIQDAHDAGRASKLARELTRKPKGTVAITNVRLFDSESGAVIEKAVILIEGDRIKAAGPATEVKVPKGAEEIDARGKMALPGLWDMHVHLGPGDGLMQIAAGVTSVRDLANDTEQLAALNKKFEAGEEIGPRVMMTGFIDGRGPFQGPTKVFADTEDEARQAIDDYARLGYTGIKLYSSVKPELVPKIMEFAKAKGLRVSGHVPNGMTAEQFVRAGADELQHTNFLFLNFLSDVVKDTRTPERFTAVAENAALLDLDSERVRSFLQLLKERKTVVDPTLSIFEGMFTDRPGSVAKGYAAVADRMPIQVQRYFLVGGLPVPDGKDGRYRDSNWAMSKMVKKLYDAGIPIVAGTDGMAGFTLHRELEIYAEAGIPPAEVLKLATIGAARVMKKNRESGSIKPGKFADLILVDGDPTRQMSDIRRTALVMKGGQIYEPAALYRSIGIRP
jgi:imidazolonepropionase-like amidohydrolase